jgi:SAM-dependent methyltransferase
MKKDYLSVVYDEKRTPKTDYPARLVDYLIKRFDLKPGQKLLEIGCGRGDFLNSFHRAGLECYGVDQEKMALSLSPDLDVRQCDISKERLPFGDDTFDIIYHKSLIEHLDNPANLMLQTHRVLKDKGKVIILTPDWASQRRNFYEDITHKRPYTALAIKDLLEMWGFINIAAQKFYQLPILWEFPFLKVFSRMLGIVLSVDCARYLTEKTGLKYFRFSVELMILGYGEKR